MTIFRLNTIFYRMGCIITTLVMGYSCLLIHENMNKLHWLLIVLCYTIELFMIFSTYYLLTNMVIIYKKYLIFWEFRIRRFKINEITKIEANEDSIYILYKRKKYKFSGYYLRRYAFKKNCEMTEKIVNEIKNIINI